MISQIRIPIIHCDEGIYLRWYFNGWHYFSFQNGYEIEMTTESMGTMVTRQFSVISKIERHTKLKSKYAYNITLSGISPENIQGFIGLLLAEKVEEYDQITLLWYEVDITRGDHLIKEENSPGYILDFEITRKELPNTSAVFQKSQYLYIGDTLCDMDDDEVIPINKQVNDIAEMQDRQADFTAQFKIRKTRAMRALFELSGDVGANTAFPYEKQTAKLVQDGIEIITWGHAILDRVDDQYYYISILSGNRSFFAEIEGKKITDLTLATTNHTWDAVTQAASNAGDLDYVYPLLEPSDDSGISPLTDDGDRVVMFGGWIWPFVRIKAIWDEIFATSEYIVEGDIFTNAWFTSLYMPIKGLSISKELADKYLYSVWWSGAHTALQNERLGFSGATLIYGTELFRQGYYYLPFAATYKIAAWITVATNTPMLSVYKNGSSQGNMTQVSWGLMASNFEFEFTGTAGEYVEILTAAATYLIYSISITEIKDAKIGYGSEIEPVKYLPGITQTDFVKMICNMFALIPDAKPRDKKIRFWTYTDLYDNIAIARDWSAYLSERDDEVEFKFGDYAQNNYLKYKDSDDVIKDNGKGAMVIEDDTLPTEKDVVSSPLSTCDEVLILNDVIVSRIAFNKWDQKTTTYIQNNSIDPRIVFVSRTKVSESSPLYEKTFGIRTLASGGTTYDTVTPKVASSLEVSFSNLVVNYAGLSRMLTKTNLRRAKFNLPVYEVAGLRHYIPIYLSQYKAYFYVNKINNYIPGQLCTIDLIKL